MKNTINKGQPEPGKIYALTGKTGDKCISNGNTWAESEVKPSAMTPSQYKEYIEKAHAEAAKNRSWDDANCGN